MLLLGERLLGTPVMSLQTGTKLATLTRPLVDPRDLKIEAYEVEGPLLDEAPSFLRIADVRELGQLGMIIDSSEEFIGKDDVIKVKELYDLGFVLEGMQVIDEDKRKLGKVEDFIVDTDSFVIQQLSVRGGIMRSLTETSKTIHRSQIVEINNTHVIVKSAKVEKHEPVRGELKPQTYANPFRSPEHPQPE